MGDNQEQSSNNRSGFLCAALMARFLGLSADVDNLIHLYGVAGRGDDTIRVLRALKHLKLKARKVRADWAGLEKINLPAIARHKDGGFFILGRVQDDGALVQEPDSTAPAMLVREQFEAGWSGELILVTRRALLPGESGRFDFSWFIPAIVKYRKLLGEVLLASFFIQLFALVTPLFFQVVIDKVLVHQGLTTLDVLAIGLLVVSLFEVVLGGMRTYLFSHTSNRIDVTLGANLYRHLMALPIAYFEARRVGDSVARVRELENIRQFLTGSSVTVVIDLFFTVVFIAVMAYYSMTLTWIVLGAIPFYIVLSLVVTPILRRRLNEKFSRGAENQAFLVESITGVQTVKSMSVEPQLQQRWEEQLAEYVRTAFRASNLSNIAGQVAGFINKVVVVLILWIGARLVIAGEISVGQLVAFNMLAARVSGPVLRLVQLWQDFQQAGISVQRLGDILNMPTERVQSSAQGGLPRLEGRIGFQNVSFRYRPDSSQVLQDITLEIAPGEILGIVGPSGSGKSTLTKLVQRLYVPEGGRVLVDGMDLVLVDPATLRRQIGVVLQENYLFNKSIRDNIALATPGMAMELVVNAAKLAGAHDFILELPEGYDTLVGEQGSTLSGGQRQRIAIARTLVTNPRILILDEATSSLDYESERVIRDNMKKMAKGRTVLIIAHRLSAVRDADRIIFIDKGQIVEQGSHNELVSMRGRYAGMVEEQWSVVEGR